MVLKSLNSSGPGRSADPAKRYRFMSFIVTLTSVTRWLLVVIGCVVLATAQPMSAVPPENAAGTPAGETIFFPKISVEQGDRPQVTGDNGTSKSLVLVTALLLAAAGVWFILQKRKVPSGGRGRKLQIDETRPLGNRQYLVVADYDGKKFLLGVTPGRIQMLTPLAEVKPGAGEAKN